MELSAADKHGADLDQLAGVTAEPVGLGVDDNELGGRDRLLKQFQTSRDTPAAGRHATGGAVADVPTRCLGDRPAGYHRRHGSYEGVVSVTAIVHDAEKLRELDDGERLAWQAYSDQLRDLSGEEYERVESESWDDLQRELRKLERRRRTLTGNST